MPRFSLIRHLEVDIVHFGSYNSLSNLTRYKHTDIAIQKSASNNISGLEQLKWRKAAQDLAIGRQGLESSNL